MLTSELLSPSADLQNVAAGGRTIRTPEVSEAVGLIQMALAALRYQLPVGGLDDNFGPETGAAVTDFKRSRGLSPADPVVGVGTINRLDYELRYLEGAVTDEHLGDTPLLARDALFAGVLDVQLPDQQIGKRVIDLFQLGNRICFRSSFFFGADVAAIIGRMAEPFVYADYCKVNGPCTPADFFDPEFGSTSYVNFLLAQHPTLNRDAIKALGQKKRPDMLRHRGPEASEWDELRPFSISGIRDAKAKLREIPVSYAEVGLPYKPGKTYKPTEYLPVAELSTTDGEKLKVVVHLMRNRPFIFWELCVEGDYVKFFNRVRIAAGAAAVTIVVAKYLVPATITAAVAAEIAAAVTAIFEELGIAIPLIVAP